MVSRLTHNFSLSKSNLGKIQDLNDSVAKFSHMRCKFCLNRTRVDREQLCVIPKAMSPLIMIFFLLKYTI